ncbi:hypothetical protein JHK87_039279 [Glycine soja]|nr:hypothetical protein JHK87_039279 [Glycine soja]
MPRFRGIAIPLVGKSRRFLLSDADVFAVAKAFAAGVILATGFVHMLRDSWDALKDPCLGTDSRAWAKFPFTGFFAMVSTLFTLFVDFVATEYYEYREARGRVEHGKVVDYEGSDEATLLETEIVDVGQEGRDSHSHHRDDVENTVVRHVVVSQVLELGIVSHSMIIGLSLGVSQSPCTMKPLIVALSFHQFFEGFALYLVLLLGLVLLQFLTLTVQEHSSLKASWTPYQLGF